MCTYAGQVVHSRSKNVPDQPSCRMLCADVENCQVAIFNQHNGNCVLRSEYIGNNGDCYISGNDRIFSARKCDVVPACKYPNGKVTFTMPPTILPIMTTASSVMATANHKKTDIYQDKHITTIQNIIGELSSMINTQFEQPKYDTFRIWIASKVNELSLRMVKYYERKIDANTGADDDCQFNHLKWSHPNIESLEDGNVCQRLDLLVESVVEWSDIYNIPCNGRHGEPLNEYVARKAEMLVAKIKGRLSNNCK